MVDIMDIIQAVPMHHVQPQTLREAVECFYASIKAAGWQERAHSKFHWLVHFPKHLEVHHMLPGCLVHERKHRLLKRFGADTSNTGCYETTLLREVLAHDLTALADAAWVSQGSPALVSPRKPTKKEAAIFASWFGSGLDIWVALAANLKPGTCCRGDLAALKHPRPLAVVQLWFFLELDSNKWALVSPCTQAAKASSSRSAWWVNQNAAALIPLADIGPTLTWRQHSGMLQTLIPLPCRR